MKQGQKFILGMKTVLTLFHRKTVARECEILIKSTAQNSSGASHHTCQ